GYILQVQPVNVSRPGSHCLIHHTPAPAVVGRRRTPEPEVRGADARVRAELAARARDDDAARLEHVTAAREPKRPARVLLDEQDGYSRRVDPMDRPDDLVHEPCSQYVYGHDEHHLIEQVST